MDLPVIVQIIVAATQDMLFALAVGALVLSAHPRRPAPDYLMAALGCTRFAALCTLGLACGLYLWLEAAVMSGLPLSAAAVALGAVLAQSHFGVAWSVGSAGVVVACQGGARGSRTAWWLAAVGMVVYAAGKAAASHAADAGDFTLREAAQVVHLMATALWAGSVMVAAAVLYRWNDTASAASASRAAFCVQLSRLATIALAVVIVTGIYNATQDTAHLTMPWFSALYGRVLTLKLVLVILAVLLGGYNRTTYLPRLVNMAAEGGIAYRDAQRSFDRLLAVEAVVMLAILAVAGVLGHTSPSGG